MWNTVFVAVHATAALVAFGAGALSIRSGRHLGAYRAGIAVMALALVPAVLVDWAETAPVARAVYVGLLGLALVMVVRAELAARRPPATSAYVHHVGFTLISLADGFAVVTAVRLGAPGWLVGVLAVGVVVVGQRAVAGVERSVVVPAAA